MELLYSLANGRDLSHLHVSQNQITMVCPRREWTAIVSNEFQIDSLFKIAHFTLANLPRALARNAKLAGGTPFAALAALPFVSKDWADATGLRASKATESPWPP